MTGVQLHHAYIDVCVTQALNIGGASLFGEPPIAHATTDEHARHSPHGFVSEVGRKVASEYDYS